MTNDRASDGKTARTADVHVYEVVRSAELELRQLLRQRAEIMKRIGTIKRTLSGLANLFGETALPGELLALMDHGAAPRRSGLTHSCRLVLMGSSQPIGARQICEQLQRRFPDLLERHKDPLASVNTVLGRLVEYAEARSFVHDEGHRVWEWVTEAADSRVQSPDVEVPAE